MATQEAAAGLSHDEKETVRLIKEKLKVVCELIPYWTSIAILLQNTEDVTEFVNLWGQNGQLQIRTHSTLLTKGHYFFIDLEQHAIEHIQNVVQLADKTKASNEARGPQVLHVDTEVAIETEKNALRSCFYCDRVGELTRCGACLETWYCSQECQKADWPRHKSKCTKKDTK